MPGRHAIGGTVGGGRHVLVVEDDDLVRESLAEMLIVGGWEVAQARDGVEGLEQIRARRPDVVLLDQRMPRMTGEQLVIALRNDDIHVPIVFMSAANLVEEVAARLSLRFFLQKPFGMAVLLDMLDAAARHGA